MLSSGLFSTAKKEKKTKKTGSMLETKINFKNQANGCDEGEYWVTRSLSLSPIPHISFLAPTHFLDLIPVDKRLKASSGRSQENRTSL